MSITITTQIECDGCGEMSEPYVAYTAVATKERRNLKAEGWRVSVKGTAPRGQFNPRQDYCPTCAKKRGK